LAFGGVRISVEESVAYGEIEDGVAQELQALIVGLVCGPCRIVNGRGAMAQGRLEPRSVSERVL
jgi:hypothetical protein